MMIGKIKDSIGEIAPPAQIIYPDAFDGILADLRYTYGKGFLEAEAILREKPALPTGFNPETTVVQIVTEFFDPPAPDTSRSGILDFGSMQMIQGKAFELNQQATIPFVQASDEQSSKVSKRWEKINNRSLLVESVDFREIDRRFAAVPTRTGQMRQIAQARELPLWGPDRSASKAGNMRIASNNLRTEGYVIDYILVSGTGSYTFGSGNTYYISGTGYFGGTVTFQPNAVIKFNSTSYLLMYGAIACQTDGGPAFLTSKDDDTVGDTLDISTHDPTPKFNGPAIWMYYVNFNTDFHRMHVKWAKTAFRYDTNPGAGGTHTVRDSTIENCDTGVYIGSSSEVKMSNLIMCNVGSQYSGSPKSISAITTSCLGSVRFTTVTDGKVLSGSTNLPIEVVTGSDKYLDAVYLNNSVNGFTVNTNGTLATWVTTVVPNGSYTLNPIVEFTDGSFVTGPANNVSVSNAISFPNCLQIAADGLFIEAQTIHLNGTWHMDIFDDQNKAA